jgi:hypothetical protein
MGGSDTASGATRVRRRQFLRDAFGATLVGAVLPGCGERPPAPLTTANGRSIVLGPEPGFDPSAPPRDWFRSPARGTSGFSVVDLSGVPVLRVDLPGGALLGRRIATSLLAAPYLHAGWYLDPALYTGGAGDGLPRGLRVLVGFTGGTPRGSQLFDHVFPGDLPAHDRWIEFRLAGLGVTRVEDATVEFAAFSDRGMKNVLRGAAHGQAGRWHLEALDLTAVYGNFWPRDRIGNVQIAFVAVGALQHRIPPALAAPGKPVAAGYVAEILLTR